MTEAKIAFVGGSGLYDIEGLEDRKELDLSTPFGSPSDAIVVGTLGGTRLAFLARHGRGHRLAPSEIPARANIYALKSVGVERIVSYSAVGSLKEELRPLDMVVPDQLIDRTKGRPSTFFEGGVVAHVGFADPFCPALSDIVEQVARRNGVTVHRGGTSVVIEGPQFSTRAESHLYRSWGASIIGMTALPEAKLAREAEMCYATMGFVTDYDCWQESEEPVSVEMLLGNLRRNAETSATLARELVATIPAARDCDCKSALSNAIITRPEHIGESARKRLAILADKHMRAQ